MYDYPRCIVDALHKHCALEIVFVAFFSLLLLLIKTSLRIFNQLFIQKKTHFYFIFVFFTKKNVWTLFNGDGCGYCDTVRWIVITVLREILKFNTSSIMQFGYIYASHSRHWVSKLCGSYTEAARRTGHGIWTAKGMDNQFCFKILFFLQFQFVWTYFMLFYWGQFSCWPCSKTCFSLQLKQIMNFKIRSKKRILFFFLRPKHNC